MKNRTLNLIVVIYVLYVAYALYASVAVFLRPDDIGGVFSSLRVPIVVLFYFLLPCLSLYFLYRAFATTYPGIFWSLSILLGGTSCLILLYFVTSPDWPIGHALGLEKVKPVVVRTALFVNFALASVVLAASGITVYLLGPAIEQTSQTKEYEKTRTKAQQINTDSQENSERKSTIEKKAIYEIWTSTFGMLQKLFVMITALFGAIAGFKALWK
jgi:hypothetical protein